MWLYKNLNTDDRYYIRLMPLIRLLLSCEHVSKVANMSLINRL